MVLNELVHTHRQRFLNTGNLGQLQPELPSLACCFEPEAAFCDWPSSVCNLDARRDPLSTIITNDLRLEGRKKK